VNFILLASLKLTAGPTLKDLDPDIPEDNHLQKLNTLNGHEYEKLRRILSIPEIVAYFRKRHIGIYKLKNTKQKEQKAING
jgi:hypothetical protein